MEEKQSFVKEIQSKHLITLSLSGVIGTGISLSSNYLIQEVGGVGTIIAYLISALLPQEKAGLYESPFVIILTKYRNFIKEDIKIFSETLSENIRK